MFSNVTLSFFYLYFNWLHLRRSVVVDSLLSVAPIVCGGFVFDPCFCEVLCVLSNFSIILMGKKESWLLYFNCLPEVL